MLKMMWARPLMTWGRNIIRMCPRSRSVVGKPGEGQHGHQVARVLVGNVEGSGKETPGDDLAYDQKQGDRHENARQPAAGAGEAVQNH